MFKYKKTIIHILGIISIIALIYFLSSIDKVVLESIATRLGWFGPAIIALVLVATQVFAPLSGSAFFFISVKLYGYGETAIITYFTNILSAVICFFISRYWGRKVVAKLVGEKTMNEIDEIAAIHETSLLVIGRTLGYYFFDFISYALSLTKVSFKKYITYTIVLNLIPTLLLYFVFRDFDFSTFKNSMILYGFVALTGLIFAYLFWRLVKKSRANKENKTL